MNTYSYTGTPAIVRLVAHLMLVATALLVASELSAQAASTAPFEYTNRFVTIAPPSFEIESDDDAFVNDDDAFGDESFQQMPSADVSISDVGVVSKRNLVYLTLDATDDVVATVDVFAMNGAHVARPIDQMQFARGKQRFGADLPSRIRPGTYLLKVSTPRAVVSRSFIISR